MLSVVLIAGSSLRLLHRWLWCGVRAPGGLLLSLGFVTRGVVVNALSGAAQT
jgi:hypothetical protein